MGINKKKVGHARDKVKKHTKAAKAEARRIAREKAHKWRRMIGTPHMILGALLVAMAAAGLSYSGVSDGERYDLPCICRKAECAGH